MEELNAPQQIFMGVEELCAAIPSGTDTNWLQCHPLAPREGTAPHHQPHSSLAVQEGAGCPVLTPSPHPSSHPALRQESLQAGLATPSLWLLLHSPVWTRKWRQASSLFLTFFFPPLNKKQNHMHKPHVRTHSTQWRGLHFASFQRSKIPGLWCRADITLQISILPLSIPVPTQNKESLKHWIKSLCKADKAWQDRSVRVTLLSACLPLSLLPKNHPGHPGALSEVAAHTSKALLQTLQGKKS